MTLPGTTALLILALFAAPAGGAPPPEPDLPHAFEAGWRGQKTCELLYETEQVRVGRCVFPPGVGHEQHYHEPHFGYVLEGGRLSITDAQGTREVVTSAGGDWRTATRTVHEALNIGDTTTSYLIVEPR